jgi:hypothetical protein
LFAFWNAIASRQLGGANIPAASRAVHVCAASVLRRSDGLRSVLGHDKENVHRLLGKEFWKSGAKSSRLLDLNWIVPYRLPILMR